VSAPLVSVIVVNWNDAAVIGRCLAQLAAQSHPAVEYIVVDNGSTDDSLAVVAAARLPAPLTVLRSPTNRGIAAGRNLGVAHARGEVVAFIDADGYAHREWLAAALAMLARDDRLGAVAPLVFLDDRRIILNGAGGTVNRRGYARDHCYGAPFEFAALPDAVLYPMGCGMVVRRTALAAIGPLDELVLNYYDDVELGVRLWARGWRVGVCRSAWVDHRGSGRWRGAAEPTAAAQRLLLGERHRIRTVLKYFPARQLLPFLAHEVRLLAHLRRGGACSVPFAAWAWNLRHLASALRVRREFAGAARSFWPHLDPAWRLRQPGCEENRSLRPRRAAIGSAVRLDGVADAGQLNFGWHAAVRDGVRAYRPTATVASAHVRLARRTRACTVLWRGTAATEAVGIIMRTIDGGEVVWRRIVLPPPVAWERRHLDCAIPRGEYELLLRSMPARRDTSGRELGIDVAHIAFTAAA
jgi:GT2 family glycosyltransferase